VAVAIRKLQADGAVKKVMVVDTDVHHGNGRRRFFETTRQCSRFRFIRRKLPAHKPPSNIDLNMGIAWTTMSIWAHDSSGAEGARRFQPEILCYVGGVDPYCEISSADCHSRKKD